jgi:ribokinase
MPDVVVLGDVNMDIVARFPAFPIDGQDAFAHEVEFHCGGSAANTATALSWLGIETVLISRVGTDPWATMALDHLRAAGVLCQDIQTDPAVMTGLMYVIVTPDGERTILGFRGANTHTDPYQISADAIRSARLLYFSGYALLAEPQRSAALRALELARHHDLTITLDPGLSNSPAVLQDVHTYLSCVNVLFPNLSEAQKLSGWKEPEQCARALLASGAEGVGLKLGKEGCLVGDSNKLVHAPSFAIDARDSTGAGDSFAAGLIAGMLNGLDWPAAALLGNAMGALATAHIGAGAGHQSPQDLLALVKSHCDAPAFRAVPGAMDQVIISIESLASQRKGIEDGSVVEEAA